MAGPLRRRRGDNSEFGIGEEGDKDLIRQPFGLTPSPCAGKASHSVTGTGAGDTSPGG